MIRSFDIRAILLPSILLLASCHAAKNPDVKRYPFHGRVESIDQPSQSAIIHGDAIPGFMDAMTMAYKTKPAATVNQLSPGDTVSADVVVVQDQPEYWLENVRIISHSQLAAQPAGTQHIPAPGDEVPDFQLTNQSGKRISLRQYRGKVLLVTFIYTRCPFLDFCPRVTANFAKINDHLANDATLSAKVRLLSISIDPAHDTPKVLRDYGLAQARGKPSLFERWQFAVPKPADLPSMADYFALTYGPEEGVITHSLSTAVIGPDGKIVKWYHGGDWQPADLMRDATTALSMLNQPEKMSRKGQ